jgi:galactokinase
VSETSLAAEALANGNADRFGQLMNESHDSLRDDYEVSCRESDIMVTLNGKGIAGARIWSEVLVE